MEEQARASRRKRYRRIGSLLAGLSSLSFVLTVVPALRSDALTPVRTGWWSQTGGAMALPPPDVPADGLYVQGGAGDPMAVSALVYEVPSDQTAGKLTLAIAGTPPAALSVQACALAPGAESFKPAQDGAWSDAPKYDCTKPVPGASDGSNVTFDVATLAADGRVAVAIVPTMATDRVAFAKPTDSSLATTASPAAGTPSNAAPLPAPLSAMTPAPAPASSGTAPAGPPASPAAAAPDFGSSLQPSASFAPPPAASPRAATPASNAGAPLPAASSAASTSSDGATRAGRILTMSLLLLALLAYSRGYGLLGGRVADR